MVATMYNNYLLAIVPPLHVLNNIEKVKNMLYQNSIDNNSLPPIIKIYNSFKWASHEEYLLVHYLKNILPLCNSLNISLNGLKLCNNKKDLFIEIENKAEIETIMNVFDKYFFSLHKQVEPIENNEYLSENNLLIASSKTKKVKSIELKEHIQFYGTFIADKISLFLNEDGVWKLKYNFDLD